MNSTTLMEVKNMKSTSLQLGAKRLWVLARIQRNGVFNLAECSSHKRAVDKLVDAGLIGLFGDTEPYDYYVTNLGMKEIEARLQPYPGLLYDSQRTFVTLNTDTELKLYKPYTTGEAGEVELRDPRKWGEPTNHVVSIDSVKFATLETMNAWLSSTLKSEHLDF